MANGIDGEALYTSLIRFAEKQQTHDSSDYIGPDGLLYCGKCHTPKQCRAVMPGINGEPDREFTPPIQCQCAKEADRRKALEDQKKADLEQVTKLKRISLMDEMFSEASFDKLRITKFNEKNIKRCRRYAERFDVMMEKNQGLLLYGNVGTGKSQAAACICNYLIARKVPVVMTSLVKILEAIESSRDSSPEIINQISRVKLVIFDDFGAERGTDYAIEKVYNVIDSRYRKKLPMIVTTNLTLEQMKTEMDIRYSRIYDRLFECCYPMQFTGPSFRKASASKKYDEMKRLLDEDDE